MPAQSMCDRLREGTREVHGRLESLSYFQQLFKQTLPVESYVGHLRALAVLHATLERELEKSGDPRVAATWTASQARLPRLQADLEQLGPRVPLDILPAAKAARDLAGQVLRRAATAPISLLGWLYVLEGSVGGARVLAPLFAQCLSLDARQGLAYFTWAPGEAEARWKSFCERLDTVGLSPAEAESVIQAALEAFAGLEAVFSALHPFEAGRMAAQATALNPEAGDHAVAQDPDEQAAALRAARRCWDAFPYLAWRYGERGWRYTQSDGAWLATLLALEPREAEAQTLWLGGLLAARGMPRLILQRKLELLHEELFRLGPERPGVTIGNLAAAAAQLAELRRSALPDAVAEAIGDRFDQAVGAEWQARLPRMGLLLAGAVADQATGVQGAVSSLEGWLTDPQRFPPHWIEAVQGALREAQTRLIKA